MSEELFNVGDRVRILIGRHQSKTRVVGAIGPFGAFPTLGACLVVVLDGSKEKVPCIDSELEAAPQALGCCREAPCRAFRRDCGAV